MSIEFSAAAASLAWMASPVVDEDTKRIILDMPPDEVEKCFCGELSFGTGGLRGILGMGTNRLNRYTVAKATRGLAEYLTAAGGKQVAVAYDTRNGSQTFAGVTAGVLAQYGIKVWLYNRPLPTPMLSFAVRELSCDAGVMITASHNSAQYNGYKVYGPDGCQITEEAAASITEHIRRVDYCALSWLPEAEAREKGLLQTVPQEICDRYFEKTLSCRVALGGVDHPLRLVYTPLHGTGLAPVRDVLAHMPGITVTEVREQCTPDGNFPTCPKPNPELLEALELGLACAKREQADLLIATDPDCDRVGVAVRQGADDYRVLTGNEVGLLLMEFILCRRKTQLGVPPVVVKTIVTSDLAFSIAKRYSADVVEVLTGFKYIGETIGNMEAKCELLRFAFGFEESCGYLAGTHVRDKDGVMACMLVAEMAQAWAAEGKTLAEAMEAIYINFGYMGTRLLNFDIKGALPMEQMSAIMKALRAQSPETLGNSRIQTMLDYLPGIGKLPPSDVLSFRNSDGGKVIVRPSGTEPKIKFYLSAKGKDAADVKSQLDQMALQVEGWLASGMASGKHHR